LKHGLSQLICLLLAVGTATQASALRAEEVAAQNTNDQFTLKLTDGSAVICRPRLNAIPLETSFAKVDIPLQKVERLTMGSKTNFTTVFLLNGDRLQGKCLLEDITVKSILGELTIPVVNIVEAITTLKIEPVYEDSPARRAKCTNNLRQIESAKEQWAMANNRSDGDEVNIDRANQYLRGSRTPICPAGGKYTYNVVGETCECSVPGHVLP